MNKERQEIKDIINEIDVLMFGKNRNNVFKQLNPTVPISSALVTFSGATIYSNSFVGLSHEQSIAVGLIGAGIGVGICYLIGYFAGKDSNNYYEYENAYFYMSREGQLRVLELSKELAEYYKKDINEKNKKRVQKYLQLKEEKTMFDDFENDHPHFEMLSQEKIDDIHKRGKLTQVEKFNELMTIGCCPSSGGSGVRCDKYGSCRDCMAAIATSKEEFDPIRFEAVDILDRINNQKKLVK